METEETKVEESVDEDGVRTVRTIITRKFFPLDVVQKLKLDPTTGVGSCTINEVTNKTFGQPFTTADPEEMFEKFDVDVLHEHNDLRAKHGSPPLKLSKQV